MRAGNLQGCNFCLEIYFSNFLRKIISAPYLPVEPLSTRRKYACLLFSTAYLDLQNKNYNVLCTSCLKEKD